MTFIPIFPLPSHASRHVQSTTVGAVRVAAALSAVFAASIHVAQAWIPHCSLTPALRSESTATIDVAGARCSPPRRRAVFASKGEGGETIGAEWRDFRAQLVRSERENATPPADAPPGKTPETDAEHWAYDTGDFVEQGSIVVAVPSSDAFLDDVDALNNVCYRKSIVLVLDAGPSFIQGIILNRPTNIGVKEGMQFVQPGHGEVFENDMGSCLGEDCEIEEEGTPVHSARWKVWFGGEVGGPYSDYPQVVCLHSVDKASAVAVSEGILPGIFVTSYDGAQTIVQAGDADPSDFWLFCGICGWETRTFYREMHAEGLWHLASADSDTILEELNMLRCEEDEELAAMQNCDVDADPRNAGLHTWALLMEKLGLGQGADGEEAFGDLMLREWATGALSFSVTEEQTSMIMEPFYDPRFEEDDSDFNLSEYDPAPVMSSSSTVSSQLQSHGMAGVLFRASSAQRSPYLLSNQGFHKSVLLVLRDGDDSTEGILLNHVTARSLPLDLGDRTIALPIRYGGPSDYCTEEEHADVDVPTVFLHSSSILHDAGVGVPIGKSSLYKCAKAEVTKVLKSGLLSVDEIMAVQGFSLWTKQEQARGAGSGVLGDIKCGFFELVPPPKVRQVWDTLLLQTKLTPDNLFTNIEKSRLAWSAASKDVNGADDVSKKDTIKVFGTDVDVAVLADKAAKRWVKVNLL